MNTLKTSVLTSYYPCKGQWVSKKDSKNYSCKCQAGWGGKYCDTGECSSSPCKNQFVNWYVDWRLAIFPQPPLAGKNNIATITWNTDAAPPSLSGIPFAAVIAVPIAADLVAPRNVAWSSSVTTELATPRKSRLSANAAVLESVSNRRATGTRKIKCSSRTRVNGDKIIIDEYVTSNHFLAIWLFFIILPLFLL
jgi:hypothetical protein